MDAQQKRARYYSAILFVCGPTHDRSPVAVQDAFGLASGATRVDDQGALLWVVQRLQCAQASGTWGWLLSCCICWARRVLVMLGVLQHSWWAQHVHS